MMRDFQQFLVVAACLLCNAFFPVVRANEEIFRMFFRYGFEQGEIGDPSGQPTEADIKGLMCVTNDFLTDSLKNYTKNENVEVNAIQIDWGFEDWIYNGSEPEAPRNVPVIVNFTTQITATDGSEAPSNQEMWEATKYFDYFAYIKEYIWKISGQNFFTDTRGLWYEPFIQEPVTGQMAENSDCPETPNRGDSFEILGSPTTSPTMQRATTLEVPTIAPSTKPTRAIPNIGNIGIPQATRAPDGRGTELGLTTLAPTTKEDEMVYFTVQIDFFAGKEKEPTTEEIKSMMCQTQLFFKRTLTSAISPDLTVMATNIDWEWDPKAALPSVVEFFADVRNADGSHVPAESVFTEMEKVDVKQFVQDYIWMSEIYKENIFYQTEDIFFAGSYTGSPNPPDPHPGKIQVVECPDM